LHILFLIFIIHNLKGDIIVSKEDCTTYLIRNIPRKEWKEVRMKCYDKQITVNDLMLKIVKGLSKGQVWARPEGDEID
tara:strand:+ start:408 stop:641 length:234 start_codon:yes stop_codon:yes gene_type:complete